MRRYCCFFASPATSCTTAVFLNLSPAVQPPLAHAKEAAMQGGGGRVTHTGSGSSGQPKKHRSTTANTCWLCDPTSERCVCLWVCPIA